MTRVLVCGGRDFEDEAWVHRFLDNFDDNERTIRLIIHGNGGKWKKNPNKYSQPVPKSGADLWAGTWANNRGCPCMIFPAAWKGLSRPAGIIRNGWQIEFGAPDVCVGFPGGRGTRNMMRRAEEAGIEVIEAR